MSLLKALALASVTPLVVSATSLNLPTNNKVLVHYPDVHMVDCGRGFGTAFRTGDQFLSVAHVTGMTECKVDGQPITITEQDGMRDFSRFEADLPPSRGMKISCEGFHAGEFYWAAGHAGGLKIQTGVLLYATYAKSPTGLHVLLGNHTVIPGMSGGPVLNRKGEVVGVVNAYNPDANMSFSRSLRDTSICQS